MHPSTGHPLRAGRTKTSRSRRHEARRIARLQLHGHGTDGCRRHHRVGSSTASAAHLAVRPADRERNRIVAIASRSAFSGNRARRDACDVRFSGGVGEHPHGFPERRSCKRPRRRAPARSSSAWRTPRAQGDQARRRREHEARQALKAEDRSTGSPTRRRASNPPHPRVRDHLAPIGVSRRAHSVVAGTGIVVQEATSRMRRRLSRPPGVKAWAGVGGAADAARALARHQELQGLLGRVVWKTRNRRAAGAQASGRVGAREAANLRCIPRSVRPSGCEVSGVVGAGDSLDEVSTALHQCIRLGLPGAAISP